jgi:glycosyltransferase involved in cell wall biosynthesis
MSKKQWFALQAGGGKKGGYRKGGHVPPVRLSQCMIVKNEESNIERALTWGKDIVCEQVVVDTGSTDRTVEIAERMGAKVFHFKWIDDFSAAKNFALSKAKGNWIAFLDADEYFREGDALLLLKILERMNPTARGIVVSLPIVNLTDDGQAGSVLSQERAFRNPAFKYVGAIHEHLIPVKAHTAHLQVVCNDINIFHTGYTFAAYSATHKLDRNVEMLRRELDSKPDDPDAMAYLADSLLVRNRSASDRAEAKRLYTASLLGEKPMHGGVKLNSYSKFLQLCRKIDPDLYYRAAEQAVNDFPGVGTFNLYYGTILYSKGDYDRAWEYLRKAEDFLKGRDVMNTQDMLYQAFTLFEHLLKCAEARNDRQAMIKYAVLVLREDKSQLGVLGPLIEMFRQSGAGDGAILDVLRKIYDFKNPRDVITAAKGAEAAGAEELMNRRKETTYSLLDAIA